MPSLFSKVNITLNIKKRQEKKDLIASFCE